MTRSDVFLFCFVVGFLWSLLSLAIGSVHGHGHAAHIGHHGPVSGGHGGHAHGLHGASFLSHLLDVNSLAIFLAWFGGCGYLLARHSNFAFWTALFASALVGACGAVVVASFLRLLHARERVMDAMDYDMVGILGRVSTPIRSGGTGEILFSRDGSRCLAYARSADGAPLDLGVEVIVTHYDSGIAYVRTWDAMTGMANEFAGGPEGAPPAVS